MNKLDFNILAGWPGSAETWEYLQNMILQAQNSALLGGKNYIISGCIESMGSVSNGIICVNGEVLPFSGGPVQPKVIIADDIISREFFGGASNPYYHNRTATFGTGEDEYAWEGFKRNNPDNGVLSRLDKVEKMLKPLMGYSAGGTIQYGSWLFWGRPSIEIPDGWEPVPDADWKGRVPVVLDSNDVDFNTVGKIGGEKKHALTANENGPHRHTGRTNDRNFGLLGGENYFMFPQILSTTESGSQLGQSGLGTPHNNLQPYKVVMFIRFIG